MLKKEIVLYGPCPTCGNYFESVRKKTYCNLVCWNHSEENSKKLEILRMKKLAPRVLINCLECGKDLPLPPAKAKKRKFCGSECYRLFFAKRFDRWIASPQKIALPQSYDEFLTMEELPCLVEGCDWKGHNLTLHVNRCHGIPSSKFKFQVGFNQTTPVISGTLLHTMQTMDHEKALLSLKTWKETTQLQDPPRTWNLPLALEGREHHTKGRILAINSNKIRIQICKKCGETFELLPYDSKKYCSAKCKKQIIEERRKIRKRKRQEESRV